MSQNYIATNWEDNKTVGTASVMNNMEKGIKDAHDRIDGVDEQIKDKANKINTTNLINAVEYGLDNTGVEDCTNKLQELINEVYDNGGGTIYFPSGVYKVAQKTAQFNIPAYDDGTHSSGNIEPETPDKMYYSVMLKDKVNLIGDDDDTVIFKGDWEYGTTYSLDDVCVMFYSVKLGNCNLQNMRFKDVFISFFFDGAAYCNNFSNLYFNAIAIPTYFKIMERNNFKNIFYAQCGSGLVEGGTWCSRTDNYNDLGGWADKNTFDTIQFHGRNYFTPSDVALDTFFDTYFWKTANNTSRLVKGSPSIVASVKYKGIAGRCFNFMSRYKRRNNANVIKNVNIAATFRGMMWSNLGGFALENLYVESCGYTDNRAKSTRYGSGEPDAYLGANDPYFIEDAGSIMSEIKDISINLSNLNVDNLRNYSNLSLSANTHSAKDNEKKNINLKNPNLTAPLISGLCTLNGNILASTSSVYGTTKSGSWSGTEYNITYENVEPGWYMFIIHSNNAGTAVQNGGQIKLIYIADGSRYKVSDLVGLQTFGGNSSVSSINCTYNSDKCLNITVTNKTSIPGSYYANLIKLV